MQNPVHLLSFKNKESLPIFLQTEMAECGLACLAMIANFHGHRIDMNTLRRKYPVSMKGATLKSIIHTADSLQLSSRALRVDLEQLQQVKLPAIIHWDLNHFVVLKSVKAGKIKIHDPAKGELTLNLEEVSKHFTGVVLELTPTKQFEKKNEEHTMHLSDLWSRMSGLKRALTQVFFLSLLLQVFALISPLYVQMVVDSVLIGNDLNLLVVLALGFGLLAIVKVCTSLLRSYIIMYLSSQLSIQMAANLFRHLLRLPLDYFEKRHIGDVVSRFKSIDNIKQLITTGLIETIVDGIMTIGTLIMMFIYSPMLAWIVIGVVVLYGVIRFAMYRPLKRAQEEAIVASASENSNFMETVRAAQSIKLFCRESQRQSVWHNNYAESMNAGIRVNKLNIKYQTINDLLFGLENVVVIYFAALLVLDNQFSVGMLYAFMSYKGQFTSKTAAVIEKLIEFKMISLHLSRIADIAMTPEEKTNSHDGLATQPITGQLSLKNIGFKYSKDEPMVLNGLSADFKNGESVAIIGPSGCGKTTLMKIMLGLLQPSEGSVIIDGVDINQLGLTNYRQQIAAVMQDDQLLSGSMLDNIAFFDTEIDEEHAIECAKLACIHQDIANMPMGYNTLIGDMGTTLSGGQRQRLLLARALYRKPKILFLDEATSNLDTQLESVVNHSVKQLNITRIIIAHRPETIRSADRVMTIHNGQLMEAALKTE
ncbi:peptidase domain-containing ABC transporter [Pleionea sediminis]|uniref:peptidase domain-containing ABC transporter n=1 Tax=Pleionea sediminis TaxID=2569479 RepID=UPI001186F035|nr:peptidase domain-containing ABC transporter [Pleionea sediminis]